MVLVVKNSPQCRRCKRLCFDPWVWTMPWRRKWQLMPVFLPGKFHRQRSLTGYRPWGRKESDSTEHMHTHTHTHTHSLVGRNVGILKKLLEAFRVQVEDSS